MQHLLHSMANRMRPGRANNPHTSAVRREVADEGKHSPGCPDRVDRDDLRLGVCGQDLAAPVCRELQQQLPCRAAAWSTLADRAKSTSGSSTREILSALPRRLVVPPT